MKTLDKKYSFYAFMSTESDMMGNPVRYDIDGGFISDLTEKVSYDVSKIVDILKSNAPFGQKWANVVMLDTLKKSEIVVYDAVEFKFVTAGRLCELLPVDFFKEVEDCAKSVRLQKERYDNALAFEIENRNKPKCDPKETRIHFLQEGK